MVSPENRYRVWKNAAGQSQKNVHTGMFWLHNCNTAIPRGIHWYKILAICCQISIRTNARSNFCVYVYSLSIWVKTKNSFVSYIIVITWAYSASVIDHNQLDLFCWSVALITHFALKSTCLISTLAKFSSVRFGCLLWIHATVVRLIIP